jgi:hypothetical protein
MFTDHYPDAVEHPESIEVKEASPTPGLPRRRGQRAWVGRS